jgi:cellulase/cellobiase CelA1
MVHRVQNLRHIAGKVAGVIKWQHALTFLALLPQACSVEYSSEDSTPTVQALAATGISVSLIYDSDWKGGYCSNVSITNTGANSISTWQVVIDLGQARLSHLWNGTTNLTGSRMTVTPSDVNAHVNVGITTSFGFCANAAGPNYHPTLVSAAST